MTLPQVPPRVDPQGSVDFSSGGAGSGTMKGTCGSIVTFYRAGGGGGFTGCPADGVPVRPTPQRGAMHMQLLGWTADGAAVLRLVSG